MATGIGTTLHYESTTPDTFTKIGKLRGFEGGQKTKDILDNTDFDAVDGYRTFESGLKDGSEFTVRVGLALGDTTDTALEAIFEEDDPHKFKATHPNGKAIVFNALMSNKTPPTTTVDGLMECTFTLKVSGKPTIVTS